MKQGVFRRGWREAKSFVPNPKLKLLDQVRGVNEVEALLDPHGGKLLRLDQALHQIPGMKAGRSWRRQRRRWS